MIAQRVRRIPVRPLDLVFAAGSHVAMLRYLWRTGGADTGRAIGRAVGLSHHIVHRALQPLGSQGILDVERQGRAILYRLNKEHWLVRKGLHPLFAAEADVHAAIGKAVRRAARVPVRAVILFGSEARGDARADSDVDLVCLTASEATRTAAESNLTAAAGQIRRQFGRPMAVVVWSAADFARRYRRRDRLVREIVETGWVIAGESLSEVTRPSGAERHSHKA
jgi:predicted nucleotidyltransferase